MTTTGIGDGEAAVRTSAISGGLRRSSLPFTHPELVAAARSRSILIELVPHPSQEFVVGAPVFVLSVAVVSAPGSGTTPFGAPSRPRSWTTPRDPAYDRAAITLASDCLLVIHSVSPMDT